MGFSEYFIAGKFRLPNGTHNLYLLGNVATPQPVIAPAEAATHFKEIYAYLASTCPPGIANEAFRNVPDSILPHSQRATILPLHVKQSDPAGECLGLARQDSDAGGASDAVVTPQPVIAPAQPVAKGYLGHVVLRSAFRASPDGQDAEGREWLEFTDDETEKGAFAAYATPQPVIAPEWAKQAETNLTVKPNSQDWAGMDGATAFLLIDRHADGWDDTRLMMHEWLAANAKQAEAVPLGHKKKHGSVQWATEDAMFGYEGPIYGTPPPQAVEAMREALETSKYDKTGHILDINMIEVNRAAITELLAQLDVAEKDARRYRWLQKQTEAHIHEVT